MESLSIAQIVVFALGTIFILILSRRSLQNVKYHGFYRFFVFEFTFVLILLNILYWFDYPFSLYQIISWILLFYSGLLLIQSFYFFKKYGGVRKRRDVTGNFKFEDTTSLIQEGIYKYIRHPMYGSLLFLALGAMFKQISVITISLAAIVLIFVILTAKTEERENIKFFGAAYEDYIKKSRMFIPFIF